MEKRSAKKNGLTFHFGNYGNVTMIPSGETPDHAAETEIGGSKKNMGIIEENGCETKKWGNQG